MDGRIAVVGGGYSGVRMASILSEKGYDVVVFEGRDGGEITVFNSLPELREHYIDYVEEYFELLKTVRIEKGVVRKVTRENLVLVSGCYTDRDSRDCSNYGRFEQVVVCTGCYDSNPISANIYGMRPAGIFSLENAIRLISKGYRIGREVLIFGDDAILEVFNSMLGRMKYSTHVVSGEYAVVRGRERVEEVVVDGERFRCDTVVYFKKRECFNPFNLKGVKAGNINAKTYDYKEVKKDVLKVSEDF